MNYMLDKINVLEKKDEIISSAKKIVKMLKDDNNLNDSEKLMSIELALAFLNYDLYKISGDNKQFKKVKFFAIIDFIEKSDKNDLFRLQCNNTS